LSAQEVSREVSGFAAVTIGPLRLRPNDHSVRLYEVVCARR
jgi:hypothetical protein